MGCCQKNSNCFQDWSSMNMSDSDFVYDVKTSDTSRKNDIKASEKYSKVLQKGNTSNSQSRDGKQMFYENETYSIREPYDLSRKLASPSSKNKQSAFPIIEMDEDHQSQDLYSPTNRIPIKSSGKQEQDFQIRISQLFDPKKSNTPQKSAQNPFEILMKYHMNQLGYVPSSQNKKNNNFIEVPEQRFLRTSPVPDHPKIQVLPNRSQKISTGLPEKQKTQNGFTLVTSNYQNNINTSNGWSQSVYDQSTIINRSEKKVINTYRTQRNSNEVRETNMMSIKQRINNPL